MRKTFLDRINNDIYLEKAIFQTYSAYSSMQNRLKKRISNQIILDNTYLITFTINDNYITTDIKQLIRSLKKILRETSEQYLFNIDYGDINERLHFHALVTFLDKLDYKEYNHNWIHGTTNYKLITVRNESNIRLYLTKLTKHALKNSATQIFYGRLRKEKIHG